ncbi:MAG: hypothetical protein FJZ87_06790 [Chloroflexi bacterium]|nr:hypothetical protein [Chloroflexota bacterium]
MKTIVSKMVNVVDSQRFLTTQRQAGIFLRSFLQRRHFTDNEQGEEVTIGWYRIDSGFFPGESRLKSWDSGKSDRACVLFPQQNTLPDADDHANQQYKSFEIREPVNKQGRNSCQQISTT